ncbi:MAG: lytic transglycosylase domain-containing protein [Rhodospirillaceae bacterium]|nr:lytic transglycosylase domain-containing protein [Rhodospirillaceae bacterium]MBT4771963.1 lytic transglycosylase domain-containing protein [Rhodospirillaceae bacterium]MBT5357296.1 lytic transglycosylase domain-containing protein [Rhodospirillaceae bacterium]MBT5770248.1 lytic transglycosylase domain-containing protein [Rhodospirillaceae bacterium]MBT6311119.1 lytic transglycosylase domain-containing protein [Rhodospirillaceae bacterium]
MFVRPTTRRLFALFTAAAISWGASASLAGASDKNAREMVAAAEQENWTAVRLYRDRGVEPLIAKYAAWLDYQRAAAKSGFSDIAAFLEANPDWPRANELRRNAEAALDETVPGEDIRNWFERSPPISGAGALAHLDALYANGERERLAELTPRYWRTLSIDRHAEAALLKRHGAHLGKDDHRARLDRMIWTQNSGAAQRMLTRVDPQTAALGRARIALLRRSAGVDGAIARVPKNMRDAPELWFERLRWRRRKGLDSSAGDILFDLSGIRPQPHKWAKESQILARRALANGHYSEAARLVTGHGLSAGAAFAESEFLAGWIQLSFLNTPSAAQDHFTTLYEGVRYPISRARGAFWKGRAASAGGNDPLAHEWWQRAAEHPSTFYGQQALLSLGTQAPRFEFTRPADPLIREAFVSDELVVLVQRLHTLGADASLRTFLLHLSGLAKNVDERLLVAQLANEVDRPREAVRAAKRANQLDNIIGAAGYPLWPLPKRDANAQLEDALVLSVIRQESGFDRAAISRAGARGMMQLMPATAQQIAKGLSEPYSRSRLLTDPGYNIRLGGGYLAQMLKRFDGSAPLALAAYNAGPHRVVRWVKEFGDPRTGDIQMLDWIETIPFSETRNYVQRVLEAVPVYRHLLSDTQLAETGITPLFNQGQGQ